MKKETKHNCPDKQVFDDKKGQCINDDNKRNVKKHCASNMTYSDQKGQCIDKETVDKNDYPEERNISSSNLEFTVKKKRGEIN